jgi:hypothetical protein
MIALLAHMLLPWDYRSPHDFRNIETLYPLFIKFHHTEHIGHGLINSSPSRIPQPHN